MKSSRRIFLTQSASLLAAITLTGWSFGVEAQTASSDHTSLAAKERWQNLSPAEKEKIRERWQKFKQLPPEEKTDFEKPTNDFKRCQKIDDKN